MVSRNLEDIEPAAGELAQTEPSQAEQAAELRELDKVSDAAWARPQDHKNRSGAGRQEAEQPRRRGPEAAAAFSAKTLRPVWPGAAVHRGDRRAGPGCARATFRARADTECGAGCPDPPHRHSYHGLSAGHSEEEAVEPEAAPAAPARKFWSLGHRPQPRQEPATRLVHYSSMDIPGKFIHQGFLLAGNAVGLNFEEVKALHTHGIVGGDERVLRSEGNQGTMARARGAGKNWRRR